ncbi:hypothetical protein AB0C02_27195 [Micromonospora sp. NPDC048999]|uniref:hypothetical protein n=1 Tax=Micromonospora sp. NPDC048999 TaxID=3155391 RepID=UPI0033C79703
MITRCPLWKSPPSCYRYRLMQPWVCLGILHYAEDEAWSTSARRQVPVGLAFGVEDWVAGAALLALATAACRDPALREEVRQLVRARLDAAVGTSLLTNTPRYRGKPLTA